MMAEQTPPQAPAAALLRDMVTLLAGLRVRLINPLVYSNMADLPDDAFRRLLHWKNAARDMDQAPVLLGQYAPGTILDGNGPFHVLTEGCLVAEQTGIAVMPLDRSWASLRTRCADAVPVDEPVLLACRHGEKTWGHWLLDILPKIVLAERQFPGRFRYAVPAHILQDDGVSRYARSVRESLAAYGIGAGRLMPIVSPAVYRFANLFDVAQINADGVHPGAISALQACVQVPPRKRRNMAAALRKPPFDRTLVNDEAVSRTLASHGATAIDMGNSSFADQVSAFRDSDVVVGDLGSNLAASVYAGPGTGMVTLAPSGWHDGFFVNLYQRQHVVQADVRGVAIPRQTDAIGRAPYFIDLAHLEAGIAAVQDARLNGGGLPFVAGRHVPRQPGEAIWTLDFGEGGNAWTLPVRNFYPVEGDGAWSGGAQSSIIVPHLAAAQEDRWLEIEGNGFVERPHFVSRLLGASVNGVRLPDYDVDELTLLHLPVPKYVLNARPATEITFHHPICPSPHAFNPANEDRRVLGFRFKRVALRRA